MSWDWLIGTGIAVAFAAGGLAFQVRQLRTELADVRDWVKGQSKRLAIIEQELAVIRDRGKRENTGPIHLGAQAEV